MEKKELELRELKQIEMDILRNFRNFCEENNITFYLSNGTLLGAIKYHGFIPWDDDIDVLVPREQYEILISSYKDSEQYKLFTPDRVKGYAFPFAKLCDMTTRREEYNNDNGVDLGVDIDIFPLDKWCKNAEKHVHKQERRMIFLRLAKNQKITSVNFFKAAVKKFIAFFCKKAGVEYFVHKLQVGAKQWQFESENIGCVIWPVYGEREIVSADIFKDTVEVEFEREKFPAPVGYDKYLRSLYGDYEQDPPLEKQKSHHKFIAYRN